MFDFTNMTKALTDENRLRILMALRGRELCVCQITAFLDLAPSTVSKHLSVLRQARLIESQKHGKWVYYRVAQEPENKLVFDALSFVNSHLQNDPRISADEEHVAEILTREEFLCAGMDIMEKESLHSPELHSLDAE